MFTVDIHVYSVSTCLQLTYLFTVDQYGPTIEPEFLSLVAAVAGSEHASCQVFVNRAISKCLLPDLDLDCGGQTSEDKWRTPDY